MITIPGYEIEKELGRGGMASVFLATQAVTNRKVAIKIMSPELAADPSFNQRFLKEASCAELEHANIITVYDAGTIEKQSYIVMEYATGGDLADAIGKGLTIYESIKVVKQIAAALGYAHKKNYVHRDVKPDNVMFRSDGSAVLMDFGIAKVTTSGTKMTAVGMAIGSPHYMSPEQARGKELDGRSDLYSLGIAFYEMLMGEKPYDAEDTYAIGYMHINEEIPRLKGQDRIYLQPILDTMLAKDPEDRYENADALIAALDNVQPVPGPDRAAKVTELMQASEKPNVKKSSAGVFATIGLMLAASALGAVYYFQYMDKPPQVVKKKSDEVVASEMIKKPPVVKPVEKKPGLDKTQQKKVSNLLAKVEKSKEKADYASALKFANDGLKIDKTNARLKQMIAELKALLAERNQLIETHLANAKTYISSKALIDPRGKNAYAEYQKVLKLESKNKKAKRGISRVTEILANDVEREINKNRFDQAGKKLSRAIEVFPRSSRLSKLKRKLMQARKDYDRDQQQKQALEDQRKMMEEIKNLQAQLSQKNDKPVVGNNQNAETLAGQNLMMAEIRKLQQQMAQNGNKPDNNNDMQLQMMAEIKKLQEELNRKNAQTKDDSRNKQLETDQRKMMDEIAKLRNQLSSGSGSTKLVTYRSEPTGPVLKMGKNRKVTLVGRFTTGLGYFGDADDKVKKMVRKMTDVLDEYLPADVKLSSIISEVETFELAEGNSGDAINSICKKTSADYVFGGIVSDGYMGDPLRPVEVFLTNCSNGENEKLEFDTNKGKRMKKIRTNFNDLLADYLTKQS